jgi:hypothetical protein
VELDLSDEVLGEDYDEPLLDRLWRGLLRRPFALPMIVVVALVAAGSGAALIAARGPQLADVTVRADLSAARWEAPWRTGFNGRPAGPVVLSVATIVRRGRSGAPTSVVGISGPGVTKADNPVVELPVGKPVALALRAVINCASVPAVIPAGAYGLRVSAHSESGPKVAVLDVGTLGQSWATSIRVACASWLARRALTVTALTAQVDPTRPVLGVTMKVTNSGEREGTLSSVTPAGATVRVSGPLPIRVPAHGSTTAKFDVLLDTCDTVEKPANAPGGLNEPPNLSTQIGLAGLVGSVAAADLLARVSAQPPPGADFDNEGFGPTGIRITDSANHDLYVALKRACGGLRSMVSEIRPGSVRYDRASRVLTLPLLIDVAPGRVRSMRLRAIPPAAGDDAAYRPLWTATGDLVPDRAGQVRVTLRYLAPVFGACPREGGHLSGFLATLLVPVAGVQRTVRYRSVPSLAEDQEATPLLCPGS